MRDGLLGCRVGRSTGAATHEWGRRLLTGGSCTHVNKEHASAQCRFQVQEVRTRGKPQYHTDKRNKN